MRALSSVVGTLSSWFQRITPFSLSARHSGYRFSRKELMTANEREFFCSLQAAVPQYIVLSQVAMGALLSAHLNKGKHLQARAKFAQKIVDYVLLDRHLSVVLLIELDDRTHQRRKDALRDAMTAQAGYKTLRIHSRALPRTADLRHLIEHALRTRP